MIKYFSREDWNLSNVNFLFEPKESIILQKNKNQILSNDFENIIRGKLQFFHHSVLDIGISYDWLTNPSNSFKYDNTKHWSDIEASSKEAGDIKFVWEKSRFTYLNTVIRYDYHFEIDQSEFVFCEITNWINANPINMGPNWICSQEISIRLLNWTIALHYYKNSEFLTEDVFQEIIHSLLWQTKHIFQNINFSKIVVRNNHLISETLALYTIGLLYPELPDAAVWKKNGKEWFEEEILYQIYEDGTYLQHSMNYNRVIVQLLSWALFLSRNNNEFFSESVIVKAKNTLEFLIVSLDTISGHLPNYGANDGSLFFNFSNSEFRNFRPQINTLYYFFNNTHLYSDHNCIEECFWFNNKAKEEISIENSIPVIKSFKNGGYYYVNEKNTKTFLKCNSYSNRPGQADNLHLDIWVDGENILRDAGSFSYNSDLELKIFFDGTTSHNTVMLGNNDQMIKGPRFLWFEWSEKLSSTILEYDQFYEISGKIAAFKHVDNSITHERSVIKFKNKLMWEVIDTVIHKTDMPISQIWNPNSTFLDDYTIESVDDQGNKISPIYKKGWYSEHYGEKKETKQIVFKTDGQTIKTIIFKN